jgi:hypothetical protein
MTTEMLIPLSLSATAGMQMHSDLSLHDRQRRHGVGREGSPAGLQYVLIMPVWGEHHTQLFLRYCIPFLLTQGNIGSFPDRELQVHVTSRRADLACMRRHPNYVRLRDLTTLREVEIDDLVDTATPHRAMTECYLHVLRSLPSTKQVVTIFPTPDCILSRSALLQIRKRIEDGCRAVMMCGLRLELESMQPLLDKIISDGRVNALSERALTAMALRHLHPISQRCDVSSDEFWIGWPSHLYWVSAEREWLLAHCFHLHPMAVRGVPERIDIESTIDGDYLLSLGIKPAEYYVCDSSDELVCLELSPAPKRINTRAGRLKPRHLARFLALGSNPLHHRFFEHPILFRTDRAPAIPHAVTQQTEHFVTTVQRGPSWFHRRLGALFAGIRARPALRHPARLVLRAGRVTMAHARRLLAFRFGPP